MSECANESSLEYPAHRAFSTFVLEFDLELPLAMISIIRLLLLPAGEWEKARDKGKPPKPKADQEVLVIMADVLVQRMKEYATTLKVR